MQAFGVYLDPSMVRNVLRTDVAEARELLSWSLLPHLVVYAVAPLLLLSRVRVVRQPVAARLGRARGLLRWRPAPSSWPRWWRCSSRWRR